MGGDLSAPGVSLGRNFVDTGGAATAAAPKGSWG